VDLADTKAGSLPRPKTTDSVTSPSPKPTTALLQPQDIIIKEQEQQIKVLKNNLGKVRTELSESRKQNKEWFGKVASLELEAENQYDEARKIAGHSIGVLREEKRLLEEKVLQLKDLLNDKETRSYQPRPPVPPPDLRPMRCES
jgi:hypothetical protein